MVMGVHRWIVSHQSTSQVNRKRMSRLVTPALCPTAFAREEQIYVQTRQQHRRLCSCAIAMQGVTYMPKQGICNEHI